MTAFAVFVFGGEMHQADYVDDQGVRRRVLLPDAQSPAHEGIPVSLDISPLYPHMPPAFIAALTDALWARDLIEPSDFLKPTAPDLIRSALLSVVREDTMSILALAKERAGK